ncbi:unnamed protein product, partial [Allacma fusca]
KSYGVVQSSSHISSFKVSKNTMLFVHPLMQTGTDATISCFLPRRHSSSDLVYVISRNANKPLQVNIRSQLVTVVSAHNRSVVHSSVSRKFSPTVGLDENCNYSDGFRKFHADNEFTQSKTLQFAESAHFSYEDATFKIEGLPDFGVATADHNYTKENLGLLRLDSALMEVTNNENKQEAVDPEMEDLQLAQVDTSKDQKVKQCSNCGYQSQNFLWCDFCRRSIPHDARVLTYAVSSPKPSPEKKTIRQRKRKLKSPSTDPSAMKRTMLLRSQVIASNSSQFYVDSNTVCPSLSEPIPPCSTINTESGGAGKRFRPIPCTEDNFTRISCVTIYFGKYYVTWSDRQPQCDENVVTVTSDSVRFSMISDITLTKRSVVIPETFVSAVEVVNCGEIGENFQSIVLELKKPLARNIAKSLEIADNQYGQDPTDMSIVLVTNNLHSDQLEYVKKMFGIKFKCESTKFKEPWSLKMNTSIHEVEDSSCRHFQPICSNVATQAGPPSDVSLMTAKSSEFVKFPVINSDVPICLSDVTTLLPKRFLNDNMVDFWLAHIKHGLTEKDRAKMHVFNSFFYTSLTKKSQVNSQNTSKTIPINSAEKRHERVRKWTKDIDIFSKDFLVVPINENVHWYVAIICFPGLLGPCWVEDGSAIEGWQNVVEVNGKDTFAPPPGITQVQVKIPSKINLKKSFIESTLEDYFKSNTYDPGLMRDEAPNDEKEDLLLDEYYLPDSEELEADVEEDLTNRKKEVRSDVQNGNEENSNCRSDFRIKQPCILVFNSLPTFPRSRVLNTLRGYLEHEYIKQRSGTGGGRIFNKYTMPGFEPNVPQQKNFYDCGLFLLQYVEFFFKCPLTTFLLPLPHSMRRWFTEVDSKRREIFDAIKELVRSKEPNAVKLLPDFPTNPAEIMLPCLNNQEKDADVVAAIDGADVNIKPKGLVVAKAD